MRVDLFDFDLPDELIALRPLKPRDSARMLVVCADGTFHHRHVHDLPEFLRPGDTVVFNDTKVIPARLRGRRLPRSGGEGAGPAVEVLLHERVAVNRFRALARPVRKLSPGDDLLLGQSLRATVVRRNEGGDIELQFHIDGAGLDAAIAREGEMPLPPYIAGKRRADGHDDTDYQTIFARVPGSVAAPTAGLHFTPELFERLASSGIGRERVTLHIGKGTFLPVAVEDTVQHRMHPEIATVDGETAQRLNKVRDGGARVLAIGTTTLRTLESAVGADGGIAAFSGETNLFVTPGYRFRAVDMLLTNFHLPRSTLFMLTCAFSGTDLMKRAYAEAIAQRYRFYSYGDACLLL